MFTATRHERYLCPIPHLPSSVPLQRRMLIMRSFNAPVLIVFGWVLPIGGVLVRLLCVTATISLLWLFFIWCPLLRAKSRLQFYMSPLGRFGGHGICSLCSKKRGDCLMCFPIFRSSHIYGHSHGFLMQTFQDVRGFWTLSIFAFQLTLDFFWCMVLFRSHHEFLYSCTSLWDSYAL